MGAQENTQLVKEAYMAFARGDMAALLGLMSEDVVWRSPGTDMPLSGTYKGRSGVANFFEKLAGTAEMLSFEPQEFIAEGDRVVVTGNERVRIKSTNRILEQDWVMLFTVRDGRIAAFAEYYDTLAVAAAYGIAARAVGSA